MRTATIAIIGGGCSGTLTALQLVCQSREIHLDVILIERAPAVGRGLAYEVPGDRCKLNVPVRGMSAFPDEPDSFLHWMQLQDPTITGDEFVSRRLYGSYLQDLLTLNSNKQGESSVRAIHDEALDLAFNPETNQWHVALRNQAPLLADYCVLALGNLRRATFCGVDVASTFYDPYRKETYETLTGKESLLIVGSGLTAVDSILEAEGHGFRGSYTMLSRHGRTPLSHETPTTSASSQSLAPSELLADSSLRTLTRRIVAEAREHGSSQSAIQALRPHLQQIWQGLSDTDKKRFLRHVRPIWEVHRHRIPKPHHDILESLKAQGRLTIQAGYLKRIEKDSAGIKVELASHGAIQKRRFDAAILCAGPEGDLTKMESQFVRNILGRRIVTSGPLGLGGFIDSDQPGSSTLSLIGPLQREALWEITAVREIREEAKKLATRIQQQLLTC
jgi:uncharacterized NAD(P)/FAD-binding protein YdhS